MDEELRRLKSLEQEQSAVIIKELDQIVHKPAEISAHSDRIAEFVRFECKIGDIYLLGTNHEDTREQKYRCSNLRKRLSLEG